MTSVGPLLRPSLSPPPQEWQFERLDDAMSLWGSAPRDHKNFTDKAPIHSQSVESRVTKVSAKWHHAGPALKMRRGVPSLSQPVAAVLTAACRPSPAPTQRAYVVSSGGGCAFTLALLHGSAGCRMVAMVDCLFQTRHRHALPLDCGFLRGMTKLRLPAVLLWGSTHSHRSSCRRRAPL